MGVATGRVAIRTAGLLLPGARAPAAISSLGHFWETQRKFQCRALGLGEYCTPPFASVPGRRIQRHYFAGGETSKAPSAVLRWSFKFIEIGAPGKNTASLRSAPPVARDAAIR